MVANVIGDFHQQPVGSRPVGRRERAHRPLLTSISFVSEHSAEYVFSGNSPVLRSAGFQTCCAADFQVGGTALRPAGLETCGTADLEVCATQNRYAAGRLEQIKG